MNALRPFLIPLSGLSEGRHDYRFEVDGSFFDAIEGSTFRSGQFVVEMSMDKRQRMLVLDFHIEGHESTSCDRCLNPIELPIETEYRLIVKYGEGNDDDVDVVYIPNGLTTLDVSQYVYEYIVLSLPLVKQYDCEYEQPRPCNVEVLERLEGVRAVYGSEELLEDEESMDEERNDEEGEVDSRPLEGPWAELSKLNTLNKDKK